MILFSRIYGWNYFEVFISVICVILFLAVLSGIVLQKHYKLWNSINAFLGCISVVGILKFTILGRNPTFNHEYSFRTIEMIKEQPELIREMVMNLFLYVPFGVFFTYALPQRIRHKPCVCILCAFVLALAIEAIQYCFGMGLCEPSDVVTNTLGAAIGSLSYILSEVFQKWTIKRSSDKTRT